jgi:hypothetical protein
MAVPPWYIFSSISQEDRERQSADTSSGAAWTLSPHPPPPSAPSPPSSGPSGHLPLKGKASRGRLLGACFSPGEQRGAAAPSFIYSSRMALPSGWSAGLQGEPCKVAETKQSFCERKNPPLARRVSLQTNGAGVVPYWGITGVPRSTRCNRRDGRSWEQRELG